MPGKKSDIIKEAEKELIPILQENIIKIRDAKGVTQQQVADALGINRGTYSNYEVRSLPPQYLIVKLAKIYNISPDVFYRKNLDTTTLFVKNDNQSIYGESSFSDLTDSEKLLIMRIRQLNSNDKAEVADFVNSKLKTK